MARRSCPSRVSWLFIGAVGGVAALAAYVLFWRGLLGVPRNAPPVIDQGAPSPAPSGETS